jgi:phenylacetate-CoA ligase
MSSMVKQYWKPEIETQAFNEIEKLSSQLLKDQLEYVCQSIFYKRKFRDARVNLDEIRRIDDISKLPLVSKEELRRSQDESPPFGHHMVCEISEVKRVYLTSGTTGEPTFVGLTLDDLADWVETASRCYFAAGIRSSDWVVSSLGAGPFIAGVTHDAFKNLGCTLIPIGPGRTDRIVTAFLRGKANVLSCTPSYANYLLEHCLKEGIEPARLGIKQMQFGGEPGWLPQLRNRIEEEFGCKSFESLGMGDISVDFWGECSERIGMHFCGQGIIYPELIDPDNLETLEWRKGTKGELVYTHLRRRCQPLVRFRSRDYALVVGEECSCGRTGPLIRIIGRTDDMFKVKGVTVFPSSVKSIVDEFIPRVTGRLEILLTHPTTQVMAPVPIRVESAKPAAEFEKLKDEIEEAIHKRLLFHAEVQIVPPGILETSEYKAKLVRFID